jgi:hypothetical protein
MSEPRHERLEELGATAAPDALMCLLAEVVPFVSSVEANFITEILTRWCEGRPKGMNP